jgi:hypothetical protein
MRPLVRIVLDASGTPAEPEDRDLSRMDPGARRGAWWQRSIPAEVGIDMATLLFTGKVEEMIEPRNSEPGLVHEPAFGEPVPPGYSHNHDHNGTDDEGLRIDPEIAPPFEL